MPINIKRVKTVRSNDLRIIVWTLQVMHFCISSFSVLLLFSVLREKLVRFNQNIFSTYISYFQVYTTSVQKVVRSNHYSRVSQ